MKTLLSAARIVPTCSMSVVCLFAVSIFAGPVRAQDAREAAKRVMPATVAVEWRAGSDKSADPKPAAPKPPPTATGAPALAILGDSLYYRQRLVEKAADSVALASGAVVGANGLVVTFRANPEAGQCKVTFPDGRTLPARILVDDRRSQLVLLKADVDKAAHLSLAEHPAQAGEAIIVSACAGARERVVTRGIISAVNRSVSGFVVDLLQTDAPVGLMSAGAPLVDSEGKLLGVIVAKSVHDATAANLAFAVPAAYVEQLLAARQGEDTVVIHRGYAGIQLESKGEGSVKVHIGRVLPDSPAQSAALHEQDEIVTIDGRLVTSAQDVVQHIARHKPGDKIVIQITRDGKPLSKEVILSRPQPAKETHAVPVAPPQSAPTTVQTVTPYKVYIMLGDGKFVEGSLPTTPEVQKEYKMLIDELSRSAAAAAVASPPVVPPTLQVQRTQVEKRLEDLNAEVRALRKQVETLTAELKKLNEQRK